jgi:hypothetical protein
MDALLWPVTIHPVPVRIIMVQGAIHQMIPTCHKIELFEFIAKNVGVRRARGEYVIVTNPDILFSEELIETLARLPLDPTCFYRIDRYDFSGNIPPHGSAELLLKLARRSIYKVHDCKDSTLIKAPVLEAGVENGIWPGSGDYFGPPDSYHRLPTNAGADRYDALHGNASGDFILTSREAWERIHGFPEFIDTFTHLDSYACYQLMASGFRQVILTAPCMLLHQEHHREESARRPRHESSLVQHDLDCLRLGYINPWINKESWGLSGTTLVEFASESNGSSWQMSGESVIDDGLSFFCRDELLISSRT